MKKISLCVMLILALIIVPGVIFASQTKVTEVANETALLEAVKTSGTVKLTDNIELNSQLGIAAGVNVTLDLNGKTLTLANAENYSVIVVGDLTITGNGTVNFNGALGIITSSSGGNITVENGIFNGTNTIEMFGVFKGKIVLEGGEFYGGDCVLSVLDADEGEAYIKGGSFHYNNEKELALISGKNVIINGGEFFGEISDSLIKEGFKKYKLCFGYYWVTDWEVCLYSVETEGEGSLEHDGWAFGDEDGCVNVLPADGYDVSSVEVIGSHDYDVDITYDDEIMGYHCSWSMDNEDVTIKVKFKKIDHSEGEAHSITIKNVEGVTITADKAKAIEGEKVVLRIEVEKGYKLDAVDISTDYSGCGYNNVNKIIEFEMYPDDVIVTPIVSKVKTTISNNVSNKEEIENLVVEMIQKDQDLLKETEGMDIDVNIEVKEIEASETVKSEIETEVKKQDSDLTVVNYMEITITIKDTDEGKNLGTVDETEKTIKFTIAIPEGLSELEEGYERVYYIVRNHNGKIELLSATVVDGKLQFESDKFSTYAIAYKDVKSEKNDKDNNSNNTVTSNTTTNENTSSNTTTSETVTSTGNVQTGDKILVYVILAVISILGIVVLIKIKSYNK